MRMLLVALSLLLSGLGCQRQSVVQKVNADKVDERQQAGKESSARPAFEPDSLASGHTSDPNDAASTAASPVSDDQSATDGTAAHSKADVVDKSTTAAAEPKYTVQRIIVLAVGGPRLIELRLSVAGNDLTSTLSATVERLAAEVNVDWQKPPSWDELLDRPLIRSGWLGNLVPTEEQRSQLFTLYDNDGNSKVSPEEFSAFITRGLSRSGAVRVAKVRSTGNTSVSSSPWGPLDEDDDRELSQVEAQNVAATLARYDFDGDRIISLMEVQSGSDQAMREQMLGSQQLLDSTKVLAVDSDKQAAVINDVLENYTFTETIPRDAFSQWSDLRFRALDGDSDEQLSRRELGGMLDAEPDSVLVVNYPDSLADPSSPAVAQPVGSTVGVWNPTGSGGKLELPGCTLLVSALDDHDAARRSYLKQIFRSALKEPQGRTAISAQLELKDSAFELLDGQGEAAADAAWRWTTSPRDWQLTVNWRMAEEPWYQLLDTNGDGRVVEAEASQWATRAAAWDHDGNGAVDHNEIPLAIGLSIERSDRRAPFQMAGGLPPEKRGRVTLSAPTWFTAMDYNSDGEVTRGEFLGEENDFDDFDKDDDGAIEPAEVYTNH